MCIEENLRIKYFTNCAVLIECGTVKILADGIFSGRQPFNIMDEETEEQMMKGTGDFQDIGYVLVSHCHNDHYNGSKILRFLKNNPQAELIVPENARLDAGRLKDARAEPMFLTGEAGEKKTLDLDAMMMEYMRTDHLTYRYPNHYIYNIVMGDTNVLLTADMSCDAIDSLSEFTKKKNSVIFLNHILLWHRKWRTQIAALDYSKIFFYHLPDEERDFYGYRQKASGYWLKHRADFMCADLLGYNLSKLRGKNEIY